MTKHYEPPEDVAGTVLDPQDDTFGPIIAALQSGDFETAATLTTKLAALPKDGADPTSYRSAYHDSLVSVSFSPAAIRDAFDTEDEDDENRVWALQATDDELLQVAYGCIGWDALWNLFHEIVTSEVEVARLESEKQS